MTEPGTRTRELLRQSTTAPQIDREEMWAGVRERQSLRARRRNILQWSTVGIGASVAIGAMWYGMRATSLPRADEGPIAIAADSIPGSEPMIAQDAPQAGTPTALIPLLGHRTQIRMDIDHLTRQRRDLTAELNVTSLSRAQRDLIVRDLEDTEQQLAAAKVALNAIDRQLAGQPVAEATTTELPPSEHITTHVEVPAVPVPVFVSQSSMIWAAGTGTAIVLLVLATLMWVRRTTRTTLRELSTLRTQSATQLTALSEGVEAIALEVERIGEGQRYLSKMIATPNQAEQQNT